MHCGILYVLKQYITTLNIHNCCFLLAAYLYWQVGIDGKPEHRVSCCVYYLFLMYLKADTWSISFNAQM